MRSEILGPDGGHILQEIIGAVLKFENGFTNIAVHTIPEEIHGTVQGVIPGDASIHGGVIPAEVPVVTNDIPIEDDTPVVQSDIPVVPNDIPVFDNDVPVLAGDDPIISHETPEGNPEVVHTELSDENPTPSNTPTLVVNEGVPEIVDADGEDVIVVNESGEDIPERVEAKHEIDNHYLPALTPKDVLENNRDALETNHGAHAKSVAFYRPILMKPISDRHSHQPRRATPQLEQTNNFYPHPETNPYLPPKVSGRFINHSQ